MTLPAPPIRCFALTLCALQIVFTITITITQSTNDIVKVYWSLVCGCDRSGPGGMRVGAAMTDGLVAVIDESCRLLLSDGVSMGLVSSNGSKPGLGGKISADPWTIRALVLVCPIWCREK